MPNRTRAHLGQFPFAEEVRKHIEQIVDASVWKLGADKGSLTVASVPFKWHLREALSIPLNDRVPEAQFWVARNGTGGKRITFEIFLSPVMPQYPKLCIQLADDFREFLSNQGIPRQFKLSKGNTVLRIPSQFVENSFQSGVLAAVNFFIFIRDSFDLWRQVRLKSVLQDLYGVAAFSIDALDDLAACQKSLEGVTETEALSLQKSRIGQGIFRERLVAYWNSCAVTCMSNVAVLRASHIKPWRDSTNQERLDPYNGLLLSPNLDAAFDAGLITFDEAGQIVISPCLTASDQKLLGINVQMRLHKIEDNHQSYLRIHRTMHRF